MIYREVARKLRRLGYQELPRRGGLSHRKWYNPAIRQGTTVLDWESKDLKVGTLHAAMDQQ
jgi:predicted RNA binding protein YcfA (HicA-like mRNA interferase family)